MESANRAHWEGVGSSYNTGWAHPAKQKLSQLELDFVSRYCNMTAAGQALDVGIGNGRILEHLLGSTSASRFYGIDLADAMVDDCRTRFGDEPRVMALERCDISRDVIPFETRFDFVSAVRVLKYSPNWREILGVLSSCLHPGGVLAFSMPNRSSLNRLSRPYAVPWYQATAGDIRQACLSAGLEVLELKGFARLPHAAYERSDHAWVMRAVLGAEAALGHLLGATALTREIFVAARRTR